MAGRRLVFMPMVQKKQVVFLSQFSGDPPVRGPPVVRAPHGERIDGECIAACSGPERKCMLCLNQVSGDPPVLGTLAMRAPHGQRIEWDCVASCSHPDRK